MIQTSMGGMPPQTQRTSDDYLTPLWVFDLLAIDFDLDVAGSPYGSNVPAKHTLYKEDDGLSKEWDGRVWLNPPYSSPAPWVWRFMQHENGIALLPVSKSKWHIELIKHADAIAVPHAYFDFDNGGSIFIPTFFAAYTAECVDAISNIGTVLVRKP